MLYSDADIYQAVEDGDIEITPFDSEQVQPASYDVRLGKDFKILQPHRTVGSFPQDEQNSLWSALRLQRESEAFILHPGGFALATTIETVTLSPRVAAQVGGKSSLARLGLVIHATAGFIDPGFKGQITLELSNASEVPIALYQNMLVAQLCFLELKTPVQDPTWENTSARADPQSPGITRTTMTKAMADTCALS